MKGSNLNKESLLKICAGEDENVILQCSIRKAKAPWNEIVRDTIYIKPEEMAKFSDTKEACFKLNETRLKEDGYDEPNTYNIYSGIYRN